MCLWVCVSGFKKLAWLNIGLTWWSGSKQERRKERKKKKIKKEKTRKKKKTPLVVEWV